MSRGCTVRLSSGVDPWALGAESKAGRRRPIRKASKRAKAALWWILLFSHSVLESWCPPQTTWSPQNHWPVHSQGAAPPGVLWPSSWGNSERNVSGKSHSSHHCGCLHYPCHIPLNPQRPWVAHLVAWPRPSGYRSPRSPCPSQARVIFVVVVAVVVQLFSCVQLFETPWTAARHVSLSFTISQSLLKLTSIEAVMPSNHLILCRPLLLLPPIFPSIRVFSSESVLRIRWPKYWSFSISPSNDYSGTLPGHLQLQLACRVPRSSQVNYLRSTLIPPCPHGAAYS